MRKKLYFGHPINTYNTELEDKLLQKISEIFPDWDIENPNQKHHQEGYKRRKEAHENGMDYFYKEVLPQCDGGVFLPFRDGSWGAGIFGEAEFLLEIGRPIWQIATDGVVTQITDLASVSLLSVEETISRVRTESGKRRPY